MAQGIITDGCCDEATKACDGECYIASDPLMPTDIDNDGICDEIDDCPNIYNPYQHDRDEDGLADACDDNDDDGDGLLDCWNYWYDDGV